MENIIGQLPPLTEDQLENLNQYMKEFGTGPVSRLYRDFVLYEVDHDMYFKNELSMKTLHRDDTVMQEYLDLVMDETKYEPLLNRVVLELLNSTEVSVDNPDEQLLYDLMFPERISTALSMKTMTRLENIISLISNINNRDIDNLSVLSPFEVTLLLNYLTVEEGRADIFFTRYMGAYPMIVKSKYPGVQHTEILHEYLVGQVMNNLRSTIPAFVYTYGISIGLMPQTVKTTGQTYYMKNVKYSQCLFLEYVQNSEPLSSITVDRIGTVILNNSSVLYERADLIRLILFQVFCAVLYAYQTVGFMHRDLNNGNILIVRLPTVMAVPVMVPVSYTWTEGKHATIQFERRMIWTDTMVMLIDYGQSSVRADYISTRTSYQYPYLVTEDSDLNIFEGVTSIENDIVRLIIGVGSKCKSLYYEQYEEDWTSLVADFYTLLHLLYTGQYPLTVTDITKEYTRLQDTILDMEWQFYGTHPLIKYDPYAAVIDFCNKYKELFISNDEGIYVNVLNAVPDKKIDLSVTEVRQFYWYNQYNYDVEVQSLSNEWYRESVIKPTMDSNVYESTTVDNSAVFSSMLQVLQNPGDLMHIMTSIYRYILYFLDIKPSISPFSYTVPVRLLVEMFAFFRRDTDYTAQDLVRYGAASTVSIFDQYN